MVSPSCGESCHYSDAHSIMFSHMLHLLLMWGLCSQGVNRLIHTAKIQVRKIKGSNLFQIYLTSILRTYKVSRKLQNIYYCQEGIIMLRSKDKTICKTQTEQSFFSLLCSNTLQWWIWKEITHLYQEKPRYNFIESTFLQRGCWKKSAHKTQICKWQFTFHELYVKNHFKARYQYLLLAKADMLVAAIPWLGASTFRGKESTRHPCHQRRQSCCFSVKM